MALDFLNLLLLSLLEKDESIHKLLVLLYEQGQGGVSIGWREREEGGGRGDERGQKRRLNIQTQQSRAGNAITTDEMRQKGQEETGN